MLRIVNITLGPWLSPVGSVPVVRDTARNIRGWWLVLAQTKKLIVLLSDFPVERCELLELNSFNRLLNAEQRHDNR